jgi:hypothetical protein
MRKVEFADRKLPQQEDCRTAVPGKDFKAIFMRFWGGERAF